MFDKTKKEGIVAISKYTFFLALAIFDKPQ